MKKLGIVLGSILVLFILAVFAFMFINNIHLVLMEKKSTITEKHLKWDELMNQQQNGNTCAAFSISAYEYSYKGVFDYPYKIYAELPNKMKNGYVFPWDVVKYLINKKIRTKIYWFIIASDEMYINWVRNEVNNGNPVIVIEDNKGVLHYITVLGYKDDIFNVFDSTLNVVDNGEIEGNGFMSKHELITNWEKAKFYGINIRMGISK